jgi:hypothetical protein
MTIAGPRNPETRKADALRKLSAAAVDVWVATASAAGVPYLVPVSLAWVDERVVIAVERSSRTARNLTEVGQARVAVGPSRDVVMIDATLGRVVDVVADTELGDAYAAQADWDPREGEGYLFFVLRPDRIQTWREADEIAGRTLMRAGTWRV